MFASDFPVAGLHASFDQVWDGFKAITADLTPAEQRALFHDNARRLYRLDLISGAPLAPTAAAAPGSARRTGCCASRARR